MGERGEGGLGLTAGAGLSRAPRRELRLDMLVCRGARGRSEIITSSAGQVGIIIRLEDGLCQWSYSQGGVGRLKILSK